MRVVDVPEQAPARPVRPRSRRRFHTPAETKAWRRRMIGYALAAASFVLTVNALVGEGGYLETLRAQREYDALMVSVARLREENEALRERIRSLREDPSTLEDEARRDLGLIKPGERLVVIQDPAPAPDHPSR